MTPSTEQNLNNKPTKHKIMSNNIALSNETLAKNTPAIFERRTVAKASDRYNHINTDELIDALRQRDWHVTKAFQRKMNNPFSAHTVACTHGSFINGNTFVQDDCVPQIVIINSHNRMVPLTITCGVFRIICSNGLIVKSEDFGETKFKHFPCHSIETVLSAVEEAAKRLGDISETINEFKSIKLNEKQLRQYADNVYKIRVNSKIDEYKLSSIDTLNLLTPRRIEDSGTSLWNVFNVAQENCIRGGVDFKTRGMRVLREIKNPVRDWNINTELWNMTDNFRRELVSA